MCKSPFCATQKSTELDKFSVGPIYLKECKNIFSTFAKRVAFWIVLSFE